MYVGRNPRELPDRSIVLVPDQPGTLFCGLAGLLVIKKPVPSREESFPEKLSRYAREIIARGIAEVISGQADLAVCLSPTSLQKFENDLYSLKQDGTSQHRLSLGDGLNTLRTIVKDLETFVLSQEALLEDNADRFSSREIETVTSRIIQLKDISWGLKEDLLQNQGKISELALKHKTLDPASFSFFQRLNFCLNALDRLEVRGRDSSGVQVVIRLNGTEVYPALIASLKERGLFEEFVHRAKPGDLMNLSIHVSEDCLIFTYKTALITGDLGTNTRKLRAAIQSDLVLSCSLEFQTSADVFLAHTRWASVGAINEINAHPVNNFSIDSPTNGCWDVPTSVKSYPFYGRGPWAINVALNGDIDNHLGIKDSLETLTRRFDTRVTTDTKIIPLQIEQYLNEGHDLKESFRKALNDFEGSHAIAMESNLEPGKLFLALKGSGQSIYVGLCTDHYIISSELYGLVEETPYFLKMDGESTRVPGDLQPQGQIFILRNDNGSGLKGIEALYYDGYPLELKDSHIHRAEITTRDIDRGKHPHFLLKEIFDAPDSIRKTLRGKYRIADSPEVTFNLDDDIIAQKTREAILSGRIRRIFVIGQGTAAVASAAVTDALATFLKPAGLSIFSKKSSDLSGFLLDEDMSDCVVIPITQSGTTTDTNRAVAMARQRGAHIIAIVNRRQSDITNKADGVFYTSDGRDIEMSVASTKAFYAQIVAGYILALFMAKLLQTLPDEKISEVLSQLESAPGLMERVIADRESIRQAAWDLVRRKQYWAVVGSGSNKVASDEIRIKLSELCYKTISSDTIEDKKHIDLSSEPLIVVCAAGSSEMVLEDVVKDVAIFKAHSSSVVVITDDTEERFDAVADDVLHVPAAGFPTSVILNTLAGHIWGYFAACSLDAQASVFKSYRSRIAEVAREHELKSYTLYESIQDKDLRRIVEDFSVEFNRYRRTGALCSLSVGVASDIALLLKYVMGKLPLEDFRIDFQDRRVSSSPIDMLDIRLGAAIDELSRPIDAIRHQAKTVTVGTSRRVEAPAGILFDLLEEQRIPLENISAKNALVLKRLQKAVERVTGYTLYEVRGLDDEGKPTDASTMRIVKRSGLSLQMPSRIGTDGPLMGTKRTIARTGEVYAGIGRSDNASIVIIPVLGGNRAIEHLDLVHVSFKEQLGIEHKKDILAEKYNDIKNLVVEYNIAWDDSYLDSLSVRFLLAEDVDVIVTVIKKLIDEQ
ncbi:MAG: SIS domain-containing protein [Desulfomonilia bacterium]|nr:SIS domain-containing protein [Desulfomonilia bacterium]